MMIKNKIFTPIFVFLFSILFQLNAQELSIRGVVKDSETMEAIANVTINAGSNSWQTDASGNFAFAVPTGTKLIIP